MRFALQNSRAAMFAVGLLIAGTGSLCAQSMALSANRLDFAYQTGTATFPTTQRIQVFSSVASQPYTATITGITGGVNWLLLNGAQSAATGNTGSSPYLQLTAFPSSLPASTTPYTATVQIQVQGVAAPQFVTVNLWVSASPQPSLSPGELVISGQQGSQVTNLVAVSSTSAVQIPLTVGVNMISPTSGWLTATLNQNTTPATLTVTANATSLPAGPAIGTVSVAGPSGTVTLPVIFSVGSSGQPTSNVVVNPASLNFAYQPGFLIPTPRSIDITSSTTTQVSYIAAVTGSSFISLSTNASGFNPVGALSQTTPNPLWVVVNPPQTPGTYDATLTISPIGGGTAVTVPIRLVVSNSPLLTSNPESVTFDYQLAGTVPAARTVTVNTTSGSVQFVVAATTTTGGDWLAVAQQQASTPGNIVISVNQTRLLQLPNGTYQGKVVVTGVGAANSPYEIPVTLTIGGSAFLVIDPATLDFGTIQQGGPAPASRSFVVRSTDNTNQQFQLSTDTPWISLSVPQNFPIQTTVSGIGVNVNIATSLITQAGLNTGSITVTPLTAPIGTPAQRIPVTVTLAAPNTLTADKTSLTFTQVGTTAPANQTLAISSTLNAVSYTVRTDQPWLVVTPNTGTLPATLTVSVNATGLTPSTTPFTGNVIVTVPGATDLRIPVSFTLQSAVSLTVAPASLTFTAQTGGTAPANQTVAVTSSGAAVSFTATPTTTSGGNWLSVTPTSGTTAAAGGAATNLTVSVNPTGLVAGTYNGSIAVASTTGSGAGAPTQTINVTLTVTTPAPPLPRSIESGATNVSGPIAPGQILAIKGTNQGPTTGAFANVVSGAVTTELGGVRVFFDNIPAPILFARQDQINVVAPYEINGRLTTRIVIEYRGVRSDPLEIRVEPTAPGIFTTDSTGRGQGAILNQNNTINGINNPARPGDYIVIYATGEGITSPATTGKVTEGTLATLPRPAAPVTVRFGGVPVAASEIAYAGSAPGLVAGAFQINVRVPSIPNLTAATPVDLQVQVGSLNSQSGVTVAVAPR